jgi:two-component system CheB/CheR fusion protein
LFLDTSLRIRRFTKQAAQLMKLIPTDLGLPVTDLDSEFIYPGLTESVAEVLSSLAAAEKLITTTDGRWFHTRIMPYRALYNKIDGVVITFSDVTKAKRLEAEPSQ